MSQSFFERQILNSPSECPRRHWQLVNGIPTEETVELRRESRLITPIPQLRKQGGKGEQLRQRSLELEAQGISTEEKLYINPPLGWSSNIVTGRGILQWSRILRTRWKAARFDARRPRK
jgi:hypothetical protein